MSRQLRHQFMPWQQLVADVAGEYDPATLVPCYREVIVTVMRQQGKTLWVLGTEVDRCVSRWDRPQRVAYTAQTGWDASKKLLEDQVPIIQASPLGGLIKPPHGRVRRAQGNWGVDFGTVRGAGGGTIDVLGSTEAAGHGRTLDLGVIDEAWRDEDSRREQSLRPAMMTRPMAQLLVTSTAGKDKSPYFRRKVELGRAAATEDRGSGVAYFEWSIPEGEDIDDPEVWWTYMPALGYTITEETVAAERQGMDEDDFRRAFGNQWLGGLERVIPAALWERVCDPAATPSGELRFGLDVLPDRSVGAISAAGGADVEVVEHRPAPWEWIVDRAAELQGNWGGLIAIDNGGPAASYADELERRGCKVERRTGPEVAIDCASMYDAIADGRVRFRTDERMTAAVEGLEKKPVGDRFVWSRMSGADVTPFMAATLAFRPVDEPAGGLHEWPDEDELKQWGGAA